MTAPFNLARLFRNLLAALTALACGAAPAFAQNVIRGTTPGWPGNSAYYAPQTSYQFASAQTPGVVQAQYAPQPGVTAYYAPASAARIAYAVPATGAYQITYAGANQPGTATTAYYGGYAAPVQRVVYMPQQQQVYYAPQAAAAPVTYYRVYQPAAVAPQQSCGYASCQPAPAPSCGSSCGSGWSLWRPFAWLCPTKSCCSKPQTCNYGGCGSQCGTAQPYYAPGPAIPYAPVPSGNPIIRGPLPSGTTIPAPATRTGPGVINSAPADTIPSLPFRSTAPPSSSPPPLNPGFNSNPGFSSPIPGGNPGPAPGFGSGTPGFNPGPPAPGAFRVPLDDPYSQPSNGASNAPMLAPPPPSGSQIMGSGYSSDRTQLVPQNQRTTISEPGLATPPASVQPLRDPHGNERIENNNRAPQLITPGGDRTAQNANRWAVIPAVWPVNQTEARPVAKSTEALVPVAAPQVDDSGWKSAR